MVLPDGCRDVLVVRQPGGSVRVFLTPFDFRPRYADLAVGVEILGYRLRPGAVIPVPALRTIAKTPIEAEAILEDECGEWSDLDDAIEALTEPGMTVETVARHLGVSTRTMQRYFLARNLPPPDFWRLLARARRAAVMLTSTEALAAIAEDCGFSDQAHMTRDLARWFGATPAQLRRNGHMLNLLRQPALGNWTGEQISTR